MNFDKDDPFFKGATFDEKGFRSDLKMTAFMCGRQNVVWQPVDENKSFECFVCGARAEYFNKGSTSANRFSCGKCSFKDCFKDK